MSWLPASLLVAAFLVGYVAIVLEHRLQVNKAAVALVTAVVCWVLYLTSAAVPLEIRLQSLGHHLSDIGQILFFLLGAMILVEVIDSHNGFRILTSCISARSQKVMIWIVSLATFFLSALLDNLTTTIVMISVLRKLIPIPHERFLLSCLVVVAANAGGAWSPIGDVTTTMLWINGQISTLSIIKALLLPSLVSLFIPLLWVQYRSRGTITPHENGAEGRLIAPGSLAVLFCGLGSLILVPVWHALWDLPPFMGMLFGVGLLWLLTDWLHSHDADRDRFRVPHVLSKIDLSTIFFFLGILLAVDALESAGLLRMAAEWLQHKIASPAWVATLLGVVSAIIDNVPLVAATMGMYPLEQFPPDHPLWHMIAYAAGTGGSLLIIGSAAGVALMGLERIEFFRYMRSMTLPIFIGYLAGMGLYLLL